jgi:hypothetical protein
LLVALHAAKTKFLPPLDELVVADAGGHGHVLVPDSPA